jgi:hypothetical protein
MISSVAPALLSAATIAVNILGSVIGDSPHIPRGQGPQALSRFAEPPFVLLQAAWRKYVPQPVVKLFTSAIIRSSAIPRLRWVIR